MSPFRFSSLILLFTLFACTDASVEKPSNPYSKCGAASDTLSTRMEFEQKITGEVRFKGEEEPYRSISESMHQAKIPALSLAIIKNGEIEWANTYTNSDFPEEQNLDCKSIFQAASLSKPVSLMAALRMQAAGEIDLEADIHSYLKEYKLPEGKQSAENPVSLANIFAHTSGISPGGFMGYSKDLPFPSDIDVLRGAEGVNSTAIGVLNVPGEVLAYSGGAYTLAELALQDHFEKDFASLMKEWILEPAGMLQSEFTQPLEASETKSIAQAYDGQAQMYPGGWRNHPEQAAAGLWSTSTDLALFMIKIFEAYQGDSSLFEAATIQRILAQERDGQSNGFLIARNGEDIAITHYGGNAGYRTGMTISLKTGNGLVYLINSDNGGSLGNELMLSASKFYGWAHFQQKEVEGKELDPEVLKSLAGSYLWNEQIPLEVKYIDSSDQISLQFPNGDIYLMRPILADGLAFIHPSSGVQMNFEDPEKEEFRLYGALAVRMSETGRLVD